MLDHIKRTISAITYGILLLALPGAAVAAVSDHALINEVLYHGLAGDSADVFTELVAPPGFALQGWQLVGICGSSGQEYAVVPIPDTTFPLGGLLVIAPADARPELAAVRDIVGQVDWQTDPGSIELRNPLGTVVDAVQYGVAAHPAGMGNPAQATGPGQSLTRDAYSSNTWDNATDFHVTDHPTPGAHADIDPPLPPDSPPSSDPQASPAIVLSLPDTTASPGDTLVVPLSIHFGSGPGVVALDADVILNGTILQVCSVTLAGPMAASWSLATNTRNGTDGTADTLSVSLATASDSLTSSGPLLDLRLAVVDTFRHVTSSLDLILLAVNADSGRGTTTSGRVSLRGADASIAAALIPPDSLWISVIDLDAHRRPSSDSVEVYLHVGSHVDTLFTVETEPGSGVYVLGTDYVMGAPVAGSGRLELHPDSSMVVTYEDPLTDAGPPATRSDTLQFPPMPTPRLSVTRVLEPGDSLHVLVRAHPPEYPPVADSLQITLTNQRTQQHRRVSVRHLEATAGQFSTAVPTSRSGHDLAHGTLAVQPADTLKVTYVDSHAVDGAVLSFTARTVVINRFGDVDGNGLIQAYDASRVLTHILEPSLAPMDSLAANVDSLAPSGSITPYDAALILQHRVGLIDRFPVQSRSSLNQPYQTAAPRPAPARLRLVVERDTTNIAVGLADRGGIVSGQVTVEGLCGRVRLPDDMEHFLVDSRCEPNGMRIVMAGATPVSGPGDVLFIQTDSHLLDAPAVRGSFNNGRIEIGAVSTSPLTLPVSHRLGPNYPNPFNAGTTIRFELPVSASVHVAVFDILGRPVVTLVDEYRSAGRHSVHWDGRDRHGRHLATGVYLCRMQTGPDQQIRPMLLLR